VTRARWIAAGALFVVVIVFGWLTIALFASPDVDDPGQADAIVLLAGGGLRVPKAIELAEQGVADTVVMASEWRPPVWSKSACNTARNPFPREVRILCFDPDPSTTRGEARFIADLAEDQGWSRLVVVASTDQVTRARMLLERCWDGDLAFVGVNHSQPFPVRAVYEWAALAKAWVNRGC
jgi:uncharacterized SAM-binding protein YcdF (DUF218 family)